MVQNEIDSRIQRVDFSEEEELQWRAVKSGYGTLSEVKKWYYEDLLKMVYFDDLEAIESYSMGKQQEMRDKILEELTE